ncbi:hypothetical protein ACE6H2_006369 [Prunus campanulata]
MEVSWKTCDWLASHTQASATRDRGLGPKRERRGTSREVENGEHNGALWSTEQGEENIPIWCCYATVQWARQ